MQEPTPVFTESILKVTASEDLNIESDLLAENINNKTIAELIEDSNEKKEEK
jgi:hypothetical protein